MARVDKSVELRKGSHAYRHQLRKDTAVKNVALATSANIVGIRSFITCVLLLVFTSVAGQAQPLSFEAAILQAMNTSPEVASRESLVEATRSAAIPAAR